MKKLFTTGFAGRLGAVYVLPKRTATLLAAAAVTSLTESEVQHG